MNKFYVIGALACLLATRTFSQCVTPAPATITGPATVCGVQTVTYTASAVAGATGYSWSLPIGFTVVSGHGTRTIAVKTPAVFTKANIIVAATNYPSCPTSAEKSITITGTIGDLSDQMTGPTQTVPGSTYVYSLPSIPGVSYSWMADGGSVIGGWGSNTVSIKAGSINGYVKATLKNSCGTGPVAKRYFIANLNPSCTSPAAINGPTYALCGNRTVSYTASATPSATSYQWLLPAGFTLVSGQGTQTVTIKSPSTFVSGALQVAAVSSCGTSPATSLTLNGAPGDLSAEMTGPSQVFSQSTNVYSLPALPGSSYHWMADGGSVVGGWGTNSVSIKAGTMSGFVRASVSNACGTGPIAKKAFTTTNCSSLKVTGTITNYQCQGAAATIALNVSGGTAPYTYQWQGYDFTSTSKDVTVDNGYYTVAVTSANGCTASDTFSIYNEFPGFEPPYPISGPTNNLCGSKTVTYTATTTPGATAYHWNVPAGFTVISGQGTKTITLKTPQTFTGAFLTVNADVPCGNTGDRSALTLIGTPSNYVGSVYGPSEVTAGSINNYSLMFSSIQPPTGISYSWVAAYGFVVGGWGSPHVNIKAGSTDGYVRVMGTNGCGTGIISQQAFKIVPAAAAVASSSTLDMLKTSFGVYPNPVRDQATVVFEGEGNNQKFEIKVIDMYGKVLMAKQGIAVAGVNTLQLKLGKYAKGIYMVNVITGDKSRTIKLLKSN